MPTVMAANIGLWSNTAPPHPLGMSTKDTQANLGWTSSGQDSNPAKDPFGDPAAGSTRSSAHASASSSMRYPAPQPPLPPVRRPPARSDNQKVIEVRNRIFVGGLTEAINEDDLRHLFGRYGQVVEVAIKARGGDQFRGFGFVTFNRNCEAADALRDGTGEVHTLHGRKINVQAAFKRVEKINSSPPPPCNNPCMPAGWMPAPPPAGPCMPNLPVLFNPYYLGPPVISNGMWICGPASAPGGMAPLSPPPYGGMPLQLQNAGGGALAGMGMLQPPPLSQSMPMSMMGSGPADSAGIASFIRQEMDPRGGRDYGGKDNRGGLMDSYTNQQSSSLGPMKNCASDMPGFGSFTTQSLSAPWLLPN